MTRMRREPKMYELKTQEIIRETDKAVFVKIDENRDGEPFGAWLPKSQIESDDGYETIILPEWLVVKKGLDDYVEESY